MHALGAAGPVTVACHVRRRWAAGLTSVVWGYADLAMLLVQCLGCKSSPCRELPCGSGAVEKSPEVEPVVPGQVSLTGYMSC